MRPTPVPTPPHTHLRAPAVGSFPTKISAERALKLGLSPCPDPDTLVRQYCEDFPDAIAPGIKLLSPENVVMPPPPATIPVEAPSSMVMVTGASGYIATFIVRDLLSRGHRVRGTVRSLSNAAKIAPLLAMPGAADRLELVEGDLLQPAMFEDIAKGCDVLVHTACPIEIKLDGSPPTKTREELESSQFAPAVAGTTGLLEAVARAGVKKIVLTSSIGAMRYQRSAIPVLNESCWSDTDFCEETLFTSATAAYNLAKTAQERAAMKVCEDCGMKLAVVLPG